MDDYLVRGIFPAKDVACQAGPLEAYDKDPVTGKDKTGPDGQPIVVAADTQVYEFLNASTASTPLPRGNFYAIRDLSVPKVDPTPVGFITSNRGTPSTRRAISAAEAQTLDQLRRANSPATYRLPYQR